MLLCCPEQTTFSNTVCKLPKSWLRMSEQQAALAVFVWHTARLGVMAKREPMMFGRQ